MADATKGSADGDHGADRTALNAKLLNHALEDAEVLLTYGIDAGVRVDPVVIRDVLGARTAARQGWTDQAGASLLSAAATLAGTLKPVSAESLRSTADYRSKSRSRRLLLPVALGLLATVIVLYSTLAFLFSSFSANIRKDLDVATTLAVKLINELGAAPAADKTLCLNGVLAPPARAAPDIDAPALPRPDNRKEVIDDLQQFASAIRDMYGDAMRMNRLYANLSVAAAQPEYLFEHQPTAAQLTNMLELPPGLPDLVLAATERVCVYQRVRYYAESTEESATILTGAFASSILPVLYALLGAGANVLRRLESQLRSHTFISESHSPRFITAAIAGAVVGLFNFGQGVSVSPLAIAFLAGYAVDVFFSFLESMIQALSKGKV